MRYVNHTFSAEELAMLEKRNAEVGFVPAVWPPALPLEFYMLDPWEAYRPAGEWWPDGSEESGE